MNNEIGTLVKKAKGDDRTIREYAKASGVDPAVISKIITGKYIPKKTKVLMQLTSVEAAPRNGVTYEQLVKVAQKEESYHAGLAAGMGAASVALSAIGGLPVMALTTGLAVAGAATGATMTGIATKRSSMQNDKNEFIDNAVLHMQRMSEAAQGLILSKLARNGIMFTLKHGEKSRNKNEFDTHLILMGQEIEDYLIGYIYLDENMCKSNSIIENVCRNTLSRFVFMKPLEKRKVSIVVNTMEAYEYLLQFKGQISYRGYLSIICLDLDKYSLEREEMLAFYHENEVKMPIPIV